MNERDFQLHGVVFQAPDVPGQWVAHCLDVDVISQGDSPQHAFQMLFEALFLTLVDDINRGADPMDRPRAEDRLWDRFYSVFNDGEKVTGGMGPDADPKLTFAMMFPLTIGWTTTTEARQPAPSRPKALRATRDSFAPAFC